MQKSTLYSIILFFSSLFTLVGSGVAVYFLLVPEHRDVITVPMEQLVEEETDRTVSFTALSLYPGAECTYTLELVGTKASIVTVNTVDTNAGGATMTFEGITIQGQTSGDYAGWGNGTQVHFKDCTINGKITLYGKEASFTDCVFNNKSDYRVWTWGAENVSFTNCVFNSGGKALLVYGEYRTATVKVDSCKFYDDDTLNTNKAAIEIGSDRAPYDSYTIVITDTTVNGFAVNPDGIPTGTTLWANKNSMPTDKLSVTVDGVKTY